MAMSEEKEAALRTGDASLIDFDYRATSGGGGRVLLAKYKWEMHDEEGVTESEICVQSHYVDREQYTRSVEHYRAMGEPYPEDKAIKYLLATPFALR